MTKICDACRKVLIRDSPISITVRDRKIRFKPLKEALFIDFCSWRCVANYLVVNKILE